MKKFKSKFIIFLLPLLILVAAIALGLFTNTKTASAETYHTHTYLSGYEITYDIKSDRTIAVTEDITVYFFGNSGFIRDIPVNGGEKVKNVKVKELVGTAEHSVYYDVFVDDGNFISIDIGDSQFKYNETRTYRITYDYCLTKAQEGKNALALTPVGAGWGCDIENVKVTLILPDGYINDSVKCFIPIDKDQRIDVSVEATTENGKTVITTNETINLKDRSVGYGDEVQRINECLRFDLEFEEGALTTYFDFTPYIVVIVAALLAIIALAVKFLVFNKRHVVPILNFEAPDKMDPLLMGKLIDTKVDPEDITSMIFYWADKGYVKINLDNQNDPTIIRIVQHLPEGTSAYEATLYNEMFNGQDFVTTSSLKLKFYKTVDRVIKMVDGQTKGLYESKSVGVAAMFLIFTAIMLVVAPLVIAFTQISYTFLVFMQAGALIPLFVTYGLCYVIKVGSLKLTKGKKVGMWVGCAALCAFMTLLYCILVPSSIIGILPKIIISVLSCLTVIFASLSISRTKQYNERLNEIVGFKNFITLTEKDRLEKMLEQDPQFYYHVLPYAQVLGVSDKWEEKFKDITVQPPQWATSSSHTVFNFILLNRMMRNSMNSMTSNMLSRPSSSGRPGGGGSFGGFSGGGHGGGGGRFR